MNYKYHLLKYKGPASRLTCPNCGRKRCFAPYVDDNDQIIGEEYGRCDHESSCGYVKYPQTDFSPYHNSVLERNVWKPQYRKSYQHKMRLRPEKPYQQPENICTIPLEVMRKTIRHHTISDFLAFLLTLFDNKTVSNLIDEYHIGVTRNLDVIFYQIDGLGRCRTGKVMKYDRKTGHRIRDDSAKTPVTWVHSLLKQRGILPQEWELTQCLFGEHLLKKYPDKPVCLVESEKTAIICSAVNPDCLWLATGGKGQLNDRVEVLEGRRIIAFPDIDGFETWKEKAAERPYLNIVVSDLLERNATPEDRDAHIDIADLLIKWRQNPVKTTKNNPVFESIKQYFSPEFHSELISLIEDLDLEVKTITKIK